MAPGRGTVTTGKNKSNNHQPPESKVPKEFPIVGIGASAGGLEAFKVLLESLPVDTGLAFVIVQHLAAGQESLLPDILSRFTKMLVHQVEDGMQVNPDIVYVIPPGSTMTLADGFLRLSPKGKSLRPIDTFLSSLAMERKTHAIGIVLSGTGTDGTEGLKAVKVEGGITFAQNPDSAQYAGMPQSAISAEAVDFVLSPDNIAKELSKIAKNPQLVRAKIDAQEPQTKKETGLRRIFSLLKSSFNVDFTHYKETVVNRRITRRMVINHIDNIAKYAEFLGTYPSELQALFNDMLIGVTSFFREPETFNVLKEKLLPELLKNRASREPIRMWIPGCSTGEEAYSFAIAIQEFLEENGTSDLQVQIFGTDVNEKTVEKARQGIYPKSIDVDVEESRLKRFFTSFNGSYQIAKFIRDKCIFAKQDLTADPPFSNLDLISCRNMLIYFDSQLQERIVPILHYALKPNGYLVLGESESIGKFATLFAPVHKKSFIYTKRNIQPFVNFGFEASVPYIGKEVLKEPTKKDASALLREEMDRLLITEFVPAAMLVNSNLDILVFRGNVTPYLSPESGQTSLNVTKILRKELRAEVQTAVYRAKKENKPVTEEAIHFQIGELQKTVNIQVIPLQHEEPFFLVLFEDMSSTMAHLRRTIELTATPEGRENIKDSQIRELKEELESSKQTLQTVIETQEATNEELRSAMEEVQSSNEELQSTNEELETAKEELQSTNEELTTLNDELKNRNQALGTLSDNQANLTRNVDPAVVMVDDSLKIRLFTPSAQKILNLVSSDTGLPISNVRLAISVPDLEKTILEVIKTLSAENREVSDEKGRFYEMRIRPYVTQDNKIDGAVLSFIDVDILKKHENELQSEKEKYRTLTENSPDIIARLDRNLRYLYINSTLEKTTGINSKDIIGKTNQEIRIPQKFGDKWTEILQKVIQTGREEKGEFEFPSPQGLKIYQYAIIPEFSVNGGVATLLSIMRDITEHKKAEEALKKSEAEFSSLFANMLDGFAYCQMLFDETGKPVDFVYLQVNDSFERITGLKRHKVVGKRVTVAIPGIEKANPELFEIYGRVALTGKKEKFEVFFKPLSQWLSISVYSPSKGYFAAVFEDISERKKAEESLKKQASLIDLSPDAIIVKKTNDAITFWSRGAQNLYGWTKAEALGKKSRSLLKTKSSYTFKETLKHLESKGRWSGEKTQQTKSGSKVIVVSRWLASRNDKNKIEEILETNEDITEHKKAGEKLRFESERLGRVMENTLDLTMLTKPDGEILYVNSALKQVTGYDNEEFVNKSPWIVHPEDSKKAKELFGLVLQGKNTEFEHRIITKDGKTKWVIHSSSPIIKEGKVSEIVSTVRDITERKKAEAEREIMIEFLRIANATNDIQDLAKASTVFFQKQSGCEAVGIRLKEGDDYPYYETIGFPSEHVQLENKLCASEKDGYVIRDSKGKPILECMCGNVICGRFDSSKEFFTENGSFWTNSTTQLLANTITTDRQGNTRNRCNSEGYESLALIVLRVGDNRLGLLQLNDKRKDMLTLETIHMWERIADRLALALSRTIAEEAMRKSELRYRSLSEHLEVLVEERTKQLKDSERLAAIGTVAGTVGHDIRNPLQAITSDIYLAKTDLASTPESEEKKNVQESLDEIGKNVLCINKIVADLQDFAKPLAPKIEEIDFEKIVNSALTTMEIPEDITATHYLTKDFPKIKADPVYLQRILVNLSNNAIQAMPRGGKLLISATANNSEVTITVQDTGEGIPESIKDKIFTPLMTTKAKGQGFGLAAVKRFTEAMGGTVTFESEAGKGTKFIIKLPY